MKKSLALALLVVGVALGAAGCAQKTESEKMMDQMNKDAKKASADMKKAVNNL